MGIREMVLAEIKEAMKEKDAVKLNALRALKSAFDKYEKENPGKEIDYLDAINPLSKQRADSLMLYVNAGKKDLADIEIAELKIINKYLDMVRPPQLSNEDIANIVLSLKKEKNLDNRGIGVVMKHFSEIYTGQYDGKALSQIAKTILSA
jgi:uncharacterized protein